MTPPDSIWTEPPDIFDGMGLWYDKPHPRLTEYRRADLVRSPAVKVKPLVWAALGDGKGRDIYSSISISRSAYGPYIIGLQPFGKTPFSWDGPSNTHGEGYPTIDAAQAAAQADYEARIMAALDLTGDEK